MVPSAYTSTDDIKQNNQTSGEIFFCFTLSVLVQADPKGMLIQLNSLFTYQGMAIHCPTWYRQGLHCNCPIVKFSEDPFPKSIHKFMIRKAHTVCTFAKRSPPCPTPLFSLSPHPTVYHFDSDKKLILHKEKAIGDFIGQGLLLFLVSCSRNSLWSCSYTGSPREPQQ